MSGDERRVPEDLDDRRPQDVKAEQLAEAERRAAVEVARENTARKWNRIKKGTEGRESEIADRVGDILQLIGEDESREGLKDTPGRVARAYSELFCGYSQSPQDVMRTFPADGYDEMVLLNDIGFASMCEHHMLPFTGVAHIGYIPDGKIIGLSKLPRLLNVFARRLQVQERLTVQVADALVEHLQPLGAICVIEAEHSCMSLRGARSQGTVTVTSCVRGVFKEQLNTRSEAIALIKQGRSGGA